MENWRRFVEMRDRYLPPGEDSSDFSPEEEMKYDEIYTKTLGLVDDAMENPNQLQQVANSLYVLYDDEGEQFLLYHTEAPQDLDNYDDIYYLDQKDVVIKTLSDMSFDMDRK